MKYDGIIFDMDGTLWDSAENVARSWDLACGEERFTKSDIMKKSLSFLIPFLKEKSKNNRPEINCVL